MVFSKHNFSLPPRNETAVASYQGVGTNLLVQCSGILVGGCNPFEKY